MPVTVQIGDREASPAAADEVFGDFALLDRIFSPFIEDSAVSRINRGQPPAGDCDGLVQEVIGLCRMYEAATGGYFSAWRDGVFDPSGLVKGWAIDRACSILDRRGFRSYFVDAGGDVQTRGTNAEGQPWRVGIRHPVRRDSVGRVVLASGLAVATSGTYEKGPHILDPRTGLAATELVSFTVIGPDILQADVYATAGCAMGRQGIEFVERTDGYEAFAIDRDLVATWTSGFEGHCVPPLAAVTPQPPSSG